MDPTLERIAASDALPRTPAGDVKNRGWRGIMQDVDQHGPTVVVNHKQPQAVIVPVAEYDAMVREIERARAKAEGALDELRRQFDERLASLREPGAGDRLRAAFDAPVRNTRGSKVGESH